MTYIRILVINFLLASNLICSAQFRHHKSYGVLNCGTGVSTIFDFKPNNCGYSLPLQIGVKASNFSFNNNNIEIGLSFTKRGIWSVDDTIFVGGAGTTNYIISILNIDIPVSYNLVLFEIHNQDIIFIIGTSPTLLLTTPKVFIPHEIYMNKTIFRKTNLSFFTGFGIDLKEAFRIDLSFNISTFPLVKLNYITEFQEQVDYFGRMLYPAELILSFNYIFN